METVSVVSTKGGVGKTTFCANLGAYLADAGLRVLLIDLDIQPTLSSYFALRYRAPCGIFELLALNQQDLGQLVSETSIERLKLIYSNDAQGQLNTILLHAPDGRLRLRNLAHIFGAHFDVVLLDTPGSRCVLLEVAVLASTLAVSPVTPETLTAKELNRGTIRLLNELAAYQNLGIQPPVHRLLISRMPSVSANARLVRETLRVLFQDESVARVLNAEIPAIEAFQRAATLRLPAHRIERRRPPGRIAPSALESIHAIACELFPHWGEALNSVASKGRKEKQHA
ncbi:MAG: ParA family protein [Proteobacteria bacterium]|nr:ParA family protein [Pseudomonadota bacterium]